MHNFMIKFNLVGMREKRTSFRSIRGNSVFCGPFRAIAIFFFLTNQIGFDHEILQ